MDAPIVGPDVTVMAFVMVVWSTIMDALLLSLAHRRPAAFCKE